MTVLTFNTLPLGYRFRPTDEELVDYYLRNKINGNDNDVEVIREIDVCKWEPWDLPDLSVVQSNDLEWFFFCPLDQKYPNGPRLNRATEAGYWKATGKDRKIKNRLSEIGTKKTLVFHIGRAPKGKRTNWVIHEYRPTLAELDGTHPGQNAFVLCRLFKKLDESVESSHCDEVQRALSSPTATNYSPGYAQSEQALGQENPALVSQVEKQHTISESCQGEDLEISSASILAPLECHSHVDNAAGAAATEVDPPQIEFEDWMSNVILDPEDCKMFSPLSAQVRSEQVPNDFINSHSGLQFQYGTNEHDAAYISEFLNSILNNSEDDKYDGDLSTQKSLAAENEIPKHSVKYIGSCCKSDPESSQEQLDMEVGPFCFLSETVDRKAPVTAESTPVAVSSQAYENSSDVNFIDERFLLIESCVAQSATPTPIETSTHANYLGTGDSGTGIMIRNRQPGDYSSSTNFVIPKGFAHRRVRMQTKLEIGTLHFRKTDLGFGAEGVKENSTVTEEEKPAGNNDADAASATTVDEPRKLTLYESNQKMILPRREKMMSKGFVLQCGGGIDPSVFAKSGVRRSILSPMSMLRRAGVVIVFCIVLAGLCRCIDYRVLSQRREDNLSF